MTPTPIPPTPKNCLLIASLVIGFFLVVCFCLLLIVAYVTGGSLKLDY